MNKFEKYIPGRSVEKEPVSNIHIRKADVSDAPMLAIIRFNREGGDLTELTAGFENEIKNSNPREHHLIVAEHDGKVIGYARSSYFRHPEETSSNICPEGWYLTGVIVLAKYRRRGVAYQLTKKRLEWIAERADTAYYFANAKNKVSFDLHAKFGFEEVTRDFSYPGVEFEGGEGVLYKVGLIHLEQV